MRESRKYKFSWDLLGDLKLGRPNLGTKTDVSVYRLMQFTLRDVLEDKIGSEKTDEIFYEAGYLAGCEYYSNYIKSSADIQDFIQKLQKSLLELGIGILRVEKIDMELGELVLTVSEDLDCSGLPEASEEICTYDEGFLSGLLESFTGKKFKVKEIDCWCTGDRTCRFHAVRDR